MSVKRGKFEAKSKHLIQGVQAKPLKWIPDKRGELMEMLRCDDPMFEKFDQVYVTTFYPGVVKGCIITRSRMTILMVKGMAKVVLYDQREDSTTKGLVNEFFMSEDNPMLIHIPALVLHGFKAYGLEPAYVVNTVTQPYNHKEPDEFRIDPFIMIYPMIALTQGVDSIYEYHSEDC